MARRNGLIGATLVYVAANGVTAGLPFLMLPVLTRVLGPADYGLAAMFAVVVAIFSAVVGLNTQGAVGMRYFDRDTLDFPRYVAGTLIVLAGSTVVSAAVTWAAAPWLVAWTKLPMVWLQVAAVTAAFQFLIQVQLTIWQSAGDVWKYAVLKIAQAVLDAVMSLGLVLALHAGWEGRAGGIALSNAIAAVGAVLLLFAGRWVRFPADAGYVRGALRFGVPLVPHIASGMVLAMFDRLLIGNTLGLVSVGVYMVALQIGMAMGLVTDAFNRAYAPWLISTLKQDDVKRDVRIVRFTYAYFVGLLAAALLAGAFAGPIVHLLAGEKYAAAAPAVLYIALGYAFGGMYYMVTNYVFYVGRTASLAAVTFTAGVANVGAAIYLVRINGIVGAAQAALIGKAVLFAGTWWLSHRCRPMPWATALWLRGALR